MIHEILLKSFNEKILIGIRTLEIEWDKLIIGHIVKIDNNHITLNEIDEYGMDIGITIFYIDDICNVVYNDPYIANLNAILNNAKFQTDKKVTIWKKAQNLQPHFESVKQANKIATIYLQEDIYIIGKILDFDEKNILIARVDYFGNDDGVACYYIKDTIGLCYDGLREQKIDFLYKKTN